jgi:glutaminyl-tRNA synthetase
MEVSPRPDGSPGHFTDNFNSDSLSVIPNAWGEPCLAGAKLGDFFQFERLGDFVRDSGGGDASCGGDAVCGGPLVFNKTIGLRDTWAKIEKKGSA